MDSKVCAQGLVDGAFAVLEGDAQFKADVAADIVDLLIGDDPKALVKSIAGLPPSMVETLTDGIVSALREQVKKRFLSGGA